MNQKTQIKEKLLTEIDVLPDHRLPEVLDFVTFLLYQENQTISQQPSTRFQDPLSVFIGGVELGDLAHDIDQDV